MTPTTQLSAEELAELKAASAKKQAVDERAIAQADIVLHRRADQLHNEAFAKNGGKKPAFAESLKAAATELIAAESATATPSEAAIEYLRRFAPAAPAPAQDEPPAVAPE